MAVACFSLCLLWAMMAVVQCEDGNWCYVCHATPLSNDCFADPGALHNSRLEVETILENNGTVEEARVVSNVGYCLPNESFCIIEEIVVDGDTKLFYRDCSDGKRFSVPINGTRLDNLPHDNNTHCTYSYTLKFEGQVCVTLCKGDFCNGPRSAGNIVLVDTLAAYFLLAYFLFAHFFLVKFAL